MATFARQISKLHKIIHIFFLPTIILKVPTTLFIIIKYYTYFSSRYIVPMYIKHIYL